MPRPNRIEFPGALYCVTLEAGGGARIFRDDIDRGKFLQVLDFGVKRYRLKMHAYVLLDARYSIIVETPMGNLSKAMQYINSHFMAYLNTRHRSSGRIFRGRYRSALIDKDEYLLKLSRHLHVAPVRAGLAPRPDAYRWSSCLAYFQPGENIPELFTADILGVYGGSQSERRFKYREYIEAGMSLADQAVMERMLKTQSVIGSEDFLKRIESAGREESGIVVPKPEEIITATAEYYKVAVESITDNKIKPNVPRNVAIYLCRNMTSVPLEDLGSLFDVGPSSICNTAKRVEAHKSSIEPLDRALKDIRGKFAETEDQ